MSEPCSLGAKIAQLVRSSDGMTTAMLQARLPALSASLVSNTCGVLARRGWLVKDIRPLAPGSRRLIAWWYPSARLRQQGYAGQIHQPIGDQILAALEQGPMTTEGLCQAVGAGRKSVHDAIRRLKRSGEVETQRDGRRWVFARTALEDDDWTPQPWVSSIRARALGLRAA